MALHPAAELQDLAAVHAFYLELLQQALGHAVAVPETIDAAVRQGGDGASAAAMKQWLDLLDLAISAPMLRDSLKESTTRDTAEALLRHFVRKLSASDVDRDKADFVITFLYRLAVPSNRQFPPEDITHPSEFEEQIEAFMGGETVPLPPEHAQLLREFPFVVQEIQDFRDFDQLMEAGVLQRVRDMKQRLGTSLYHPRVLAIVAAYNVFFGKRFDELFRETTRQIKKFAERIQEQGGSISTRVEGDVTVQHLADVEEDRILHTEYGKAQEHFRKISKFKRAVDRRNAGRPGGGASPFVTPESAPPPRVEEPLFASSPTVLAQETAPGGFNPVVEEGKLRSMQDSIRNFVKAADPRAAGVFPLRKGNLALLPQEIEGFRNDYSGEKSFRADYASALRQIVALQACLLTELQEFQAKQKSAYLWKPHADALTYLLSAAQKAEQQYEAVVAVAQQRGLTDKIQALTGSLQRLRTQVQNAAKGLEKAGSSAGA